MPENIRSHFATVRPPAPSAKSLAPEEDARLRAALRRCSPSTYYAAYQFLLTGDLQRVPAILLGVIERHVEPGLRARLRTPDDSLRLSEDLGIDSLTLLEIAAVVEDVLPVSIDSGEFHSLQTFGGIRRLIDGKLRLAASGGSAPPEEFPSRPVAVGADGGLPGVRQPPSCSAGLR